MSDQESKDIFGYTYLFASFRDFAQTILTTTFYEKRSNLNICDSLLSILV